jgi:hypothetical protein
MNFFKYLYATTAACALCLLTTSASAQNGNPPPETHGDDLCIGLNNDFGRDGNQCALWFEDTEFNPNHNVPAWLATPKQLFPNVTGPAGAGNFYFNIGFDVILAYNPNTMQNAPVMQQARWTQVSITQGLEIWKGSSRYYAAPGTPVVGSWLFSGNFHQHFHVRAFRPGTYRFTFRMTDAKKANGTNVANSPNYTLIVQNLPTVRGRAILPGWARVDTTNDQIGNRARVFFFAADTIGPVTEADAIRFTDVYLDRLGRFLLPDKLFTAAQMNASKGRYRIGIKPLTAPGLARLLPGIYTLSPNSPPTAPPVTLPLGDANRDGQITSADIDLITANIGNPNFPPDTDVNGDGVVNATDVNLALGNLGKVSDF